MLYVIVGMALTFFAIGMMLTEQNARYLLSGYNMLGKEEQNQVDIRSYIAAFRKFHIVLATSFLIINLLLIYLNSEIAGGVFLVGYPIVAYLCFIIASRKYF